MVSSGVVWCLKDNQWIPLQLSSIRLHGVITEAQWTFVSEFLKKVSSQQLILQENGLWALTDKQSEILQNHQKHVAQSVDKSKEALPLPEKENDKHLWEDLIVNEERKRDIVRRHSLGQIPEFEVAESNKNNTANRRASVSSNLYNDRLLAEPCVNNENSDKKRMQRRPSEQCDEIVLRLLKKYSKYGKDALNNDILDAIKKKEISEENNECDKANNVAKPAALRTRKMSYLPTLEKLYENCDEVLGRRRLDCLRTEDEQFENERNEHVIRWLKQQQEQHQGCETNSSFWDSSKLNFSSEARKHSLASKSSSSGFESRKSSIISNLDETSSRHSNLASPALTTVSSRKFSSGLMEEKTRKTSVTSISSCSDNEESSSALFNSWQTIIKRNVGDSKNFEKKIRKQREAWARNTRKFSSGSDSAPNFNSTNLEEQE